MDSQPINSRASTTEAKNSGVGLGKFFGRLVRAGRGNKTDTSNTFSHQVRTHIKSLTQRSVRLENPKQPESSKLKELDDHPQKWLPKNVKYTDDGVLDLSQVKVYSEEFEPDPARGEKNNTC